MYLVTWKLTKHIERKEILMTTLLTLPLRHFEKDFCQTWASRVLLENWGIPG